MNKQKGLVSLITVLIISTSILISAVGAAYLNIGGLDISYLSSAGKRAFYLGEACIEEALIQLKNNNNFSTTTANMVLQDGSCTYTVTDMGGTKEVISIGTTGEHYKQINIEAIIQNNVPQLTN